MDGAETCFNKINRCNLYAQFDPVQGWGQPRQWVQEERARPKKKPLSAANCCTTTKIQWRPTSQEGLGIFVQCSKITTQSTLIICPRTLSLKSHSLCQYSKVAVTDWLTHSVTKVRYRAARAAKNLQNWPLKCLWLIDNKLIQSVGSDFCNFELDLYFQYLAWNENHWASGWLLHHAVP